MVIDQCNSCYGFGGFCSLADDGDKLCEAYEPTIDNSGMFRRIFSPKGRIRRTEFCLSYILYYILYIFMIILLKIGLHDSLTVIFIGIVEIFLAIVLLLQGIKRCHDLGNSGWWILLPIYSPFWLMFGKGDEGINEYGSDPKQSYKSQIFNEEEYLK